MAASPWAYLLLSIRTALEARDSGILASYIVDAGGEGAQVVADAGTTQLRPGDADSVFDQLFNNGSLPLIQGYFGYEGAECITLMTSGWVGPASLPPYQPVITLPPNFVTPTPDRPPMDGPGRMSEQVHGPAFAWVVCDYGNQQPAITGWIDGDYHELVFILYQNELSGPDPSPVYTRVLP